MTQADDNAPPKPGTLFTIPQTKDFLQSLAKAVLAGNLPHANGTPPDALTLTRFEILLPSRRACRALEEQFIALAPGDCTLLPRIRPLGDVDEILALVAPGSPLAKDPSQLRPVVPELERRLLLTEFVRAWSENMRKAAVDDEDGVFPVANLAQATALARELMELMDEAELEGADLSKVHDLGGDFPEHWNLTVRFLSIITEQWPHVMRENNQMTSVARRDLLIRCDAARFELSPPDHPIILAGEVAGVAAAADLMEAIARAPQGAVVLPGLDRSLDPQSWSEIVPDHPEHPQYGLKHFMDRFDRLPVDVPEVTGCAPDAVELARLRLISETMRPARTTHRWRTLFDEGSPDIEQMKTALSHFNLIETATEREEAELVALILREAIETPGQTAALVTPDRRLARRVFARMEKWGLLIDDSGGEPLPRTRAGAFADLVIEAVAKDFAPSTLLALLKHPLTRLGRDIGEMRRSARALELFALRQHRLESGLFSIKRNLQRARNRMENNGERHPVIRRLREEDLLLAEKLLEDLETVFEPFVNAFRLHAKLALKEFAQMHKDTLVQIAARPLEQDEKTEKKPEKKNEPQADLFATPEPTEPSEPSEPEEQHSELWANEAGEALDDFFDKLLDQVHPASTTAREYAGLYHSLMSDQVVRNRLPVHPRLFMWGPMEARLLSADIVVLGALNEGSWPQPADADAWLSRPMRTEIGLPSPERRIGRSAHDMSQALGNTKTYLTRATKIDGVPSVPSRWLLRLQALCNGAKLGEQLLAPANERWLELVHERDRIRATDRIARPNPAPPIASRPRLLPVTGIEKWIANPYAIYAGKILNLSPLPELGAEPDASMRGQILHSALHEFSKKYELELPENSGEILEKLGHDAMDRLGEHARIIAFWKPQFARFAHWFGESEAARRDGILRHLPECEGRMSFDSAGGEFTLTARADRIDLQKDGSLIIYDYKSSKKETRDVRALKSPQLPLEAVIGEAGGFADLGELTSSDLVFVAATGKEERGRQDSCIDKNISGPQLASAALAGLKQLVEQYDQPETGYPALRRAGFEAAYRYDDFEHLARVKEWAVEDD
ncbi:MAG: double-strand break repair protein AddB [Hyphomicrobiaceae bacterium]|nr:double-strand break repair protein AddB [Hyphomicrobiaceae bacterium]